MADVLVVLRLDGNLTDQGFRVMAEIGPEGDRPHSEVQGRLPASPSLLQALRQWQRDYRDLKFATRIRPRDIQYKGSIHFIDDCKTSAQRLDDRLRTWLNHDDFRPIDQRLRECLNPGDHIRILLRSDERTLWQLPWHLWPLLERYPQAEVVFSGATLHPPIGRPTHPQATVKILAILGHHDGIDVERDRQQLFSLPNADVTLLVEPQREQLNDQLWDQHWDILFFAGHSRTHQTQMDQNPTSQTSKDRNPADQQQADQNQADPNQSSPAQLSQAKGFIDINSDDSLSLAELSYGVKRAIAQGLQLAIFNSCDGLGLVAELATLNLPQAIVMREPIPDAVAQQFLTHFLSAFAQGHSLHLAEREARERLQVLEKDFPCASWLPLLYQNAATRPLTWQALLTPLQTQSPKDFGDALPQTLSDPAQNVEEALARTTPDILKNSKAIDKPNTSHTSPLFPFLSIPCITLVVALLRWVGGLEATELHAYDQFMRLQPNETQDERLLIITVDIPDIDYQREQGMDLEGSLSSEALELLFQKLKPFEPQSIGLDIYTSALPDPADAAHALPASQSPSSTLTEAALQQTQASTDIPTFAICKVPSPQDGTPYGIAPPTNLASDYVGFSDFVSDRDSILRRHLLAFKNPNPTASCTAGNAFNLLLALHYLETAEGIAYDINSQQEFQFTPAPLASGAQGKPIVFRRLTANAGGYQGIGADGYQVLLRYRTVRSLHNIAPTISLRDLLTDNVSSAAIQQLQGRIVLVGVTDLANDVWIAPHSRGQSGAPKLVPGVTMQAQMISQLLSAVLDQRPLMWWWPEWVEVLWIALWSGLGALIAYVSRRPLVLVGLGLLGGMSVWGISYGVFMQAGWIPVVPAAIAFILTLLVYRWLRAIRNVKTSS